MSLYVAFGTNIEPFRILAIDFSDAVKQANELFVNESYNGICTLEYWEFKYGKLEGYEEE